LLLGVLFNSACAVPLAPGYKITKETRSIHFAPDSSGELEIEAGFTLQNSGTTALHFIDVDLPEARVFGRKNLRAALDGHETALELLPEEYRPDHPNRLRINLNSAWARGQTHQLDFDYALSSPEDSGAHITMAADAFHLGAGGWTVLPQPPQHLLSPYPRRPDKMIYSVRVPSDFLVLGRGKLVSRKRQDHETEYLFRLRKTDLAAYIVAGRYVETPFRVSGGAVTFWTFRPLVGDSGLGPRRIRAAWATLESDFGPIDVTGPAPHIVESPSLRSRIAGESVPAVAPFPGGVLVNEETLALGIASDGFVERVSHALAHNWFGDQMYPTGAAALAMGEGLPEYATIVIDEATGGSPARKRRIQDYLRRYDDALKQGQEKPLGVTVLTDTPQQRDMALAKAPLMYVALEDTCGEESVRNGLRRLVNLLRGQEVGFDDMRSALESTCGKDLGEFFREWLYKKGLPASFRSRYGQPESAGN
jgi:hypothetical protein